MTRPPVSDAHPLRIGTRGSPLALAQAYETRDRLAAAHGLPLSAFDIEVIKTTGDRVQDRALKELGGKGLFTREIEEALLAGSIDIAVHSMKDMPTLQPGGLVLDCYLPREDVRDALIAPSIGGFEAIPEGAVVGTSSLRRKSQLLHRRPDLEVVNFRGSVQTRLRKLAEGVAQATFLAQAGLNRLGMTPEIAATPIDPDDMLPAIAQGAIGVERREADETTAELLAPIHDTLTGLRLAAERSFLAGLDGSCETPIAGLAELVGDRLILRGEVLRPDGSDCIADSESGGLHEGFDIGARLAARMLNAAPKDFFDWR